MSKRPKLDPLKEIADAMKLSAEEWGDNRARSWIWGIVSLSAGNPWMGSGLSVELTPLRNSMPGLSRWRPEWAICTI